MFEEMQRHKVFSNAKYMPSPKYENVKGVVGGLGGMSEK